MPMEPSPFNGLNPSTLLRTSSAQRLNGLNDLNLVDCRRLEPLELLELLEPIRFLSDRFTFDSSGHRRTNSATSLCQRFIASSYCAVVKPSSGYQRLKPVSRTGLPCRN